MPRTYVHLSGRVKALRPPQYEPCLLGVDGLETAWERLGEQDRLDGRFIVIRSNPLGPRYLVREDDVPTERQVRRYRKRFA